MADWNNFRRLGPWALKLAPSVWGYLNNPRWTDTPGPRVTYDGNESAEPEQFDIDQTPHSVESSVIHEPCGHWHKKVPPGGGGGGGGGVKTFIFFSDHTRECGPSIVKAHLDAGVFTIDKQINLTGNTYAELFDQSALGDDGSVYTCPRTNPFRVKSYTSDLIERSTWNYGGNDGIFDNDNFMFGYVTPGDTADLYGATGGNCAVSWARKKLYVNGTDGAGHAFVIIFTINPDNTLTWSSNVLMPSAGGASGIAILEPNLYVGTNDSTGVIAVMDMDTLTVSYSTPLTPAIYDASVFMFHNGLLYAGGNQIVASPYSNTAFMIVIDPSTMTQLYLWQDTGGYITGFKGIFIYNNYLYSCYFDHSSPNAYKIRKFPLNLSTITDSAALDNYINAALAVDTTAVKGYVVAYSHYNATGGIAPCDNNFYRTTQKVIPFELDTLVLDSSLTGPTQWTVQLIIAGSSAPTPPGPIIKPIPPAPNPQPAPPPPIVPVMPGTPVADPAGTRLLNFPQLNLALSIGPGQIQYYKYVVKPEDLRNMIQFQTIANDSGPVVDMIVKKSNGNTAQWPVAADWDILNTIAPFGSGFATNVLPTADGTYFWLFGNGFGGETVTLTGANNVADTYYVMLINKGGSVSNYNIGAVNL